MVQKILAEYTNQIAKNKARDTHDVFWSLFIIINLLVWGILCVFKLTKYFTLVQAIGGECLFVLVLWFVAYALIEMAYAPSKKGK